MHGLKGIKRILSVSLSVLLLFSAAAVSLNVAAEEEPVVLYAGDAVPAEHTAITTLSDEFGVEIPDEDIETFHTVGDVVNYLEERL